VARRIDVARVTVDFSDVQDFEPFEGEHPVLIEKVEYVEAQSEDKYDYLSWELTVSDGEFKGRKGWLNTSFSPKALFKLKEVLENLGLYDDELDIDYDEDTMLVTTPELSGLPAVGVFSIGSYNNKPSLNVDTLISSDTPKQGEKKEKGASKKKDEKSGGKKKFK